MKLNISLIFGGIAVLALLLIVLFIVLDTGEKPPQLGEEIIFVPAETEPLPSVGGNKLSISFKDGTTTLVPNFTLNNQPEGANPVNGYEVAGGEEQEFHSIYFPEGHYFLVTLLQEPIGQARVRAEQELRSVLGLQNADLCKLNAEVRVSEEINEVYSGSNLGFSFCSDSVQLPQ